MTDNTMTASRILFWSFIWLYKYDYNHAILYYELILFCIICVRFVMNIYNIQRDYINMSNIYIIDLFCGCGGFSEGARTTGAHIILAIDNWEEALDIHKLNHPESVHMLMDLGGDASEFINIIQKTIDEKVPEGGHVHIHGSPPCQNLSKVNVLRHEPEGLRLVDWYLNIIKHIQPDSWTMEQVCGDSLKPLVEHYNGIYVDLLKLGVPNTRRRVIIGDNLNLDKISEYYCEAKTMKDVLVDEGSDYEPRFTRQTNGCRKKGVYATRVLDAVSYTVTSQFPKLFDPITCTFKTLDCDILARLQTFPVGYFNGSSIGKGMKRKMIGNAVPPRLSCVLMNLI